MHADDILSGAELFRAVRIAATHGHLRPFTSAGLRTLPDAPCIWLEMTCRAETCRFNLYDRNPLLSCTILAIRLLYRKVDEPTARRPFFCPSNLMQPG